MKTVNNPSYRTAKNIQTSCKGTPKAASLKLDELEGGEETNENFWMYF